MSDDQVIESEEPVSLEVLLAEGLVIDYLHRRPTHIACRVCEDNDQVYTVKTWDSEEDEPQFFTVNLATDTCTEVE